MVYTTGDSQTVFAQIASRAYLSTLQQSSREKQQMKTSSQVLMMHVKRMQPHLRNQVCVNTYFISKLTSFAMHMMTQETVLSLNSEGLFQLWFDCRWCIQRVTHKLFSHRLPHQHISPHSNKVLERSSNSNECLGFDDACREDAVAFSKLKMCQ